MSTAVQTAKSRYLCYRVIGYLLLILSVFMLLSALPLALRQQSVTSVRGLDQ